MSSPTSAPKPSAPGKDRNLKLRASCDSCAASKVKCSKEHPICARCSAINSPCIYGVSRKHGKPGRTRKRNPDGTPFVKAAKQRLSPGASEFSIFKLQSEPTLQQTDLEITSNWASDWSPTPSLPDTPGFRFETAPGSSYASDIHSDTTFMDTAALATQQALPEPMPTIDSNHLFRDPFAAKQTVQSDSPDWQALRDYIGGNDVNSMEYYPTGPKTVEHLRSVSSISVPYSPMSQTRGSHDAMAQYANASLDNSHCCYTLAYSTLDSLRHIKPNYPVFTNESFHAVLPIAQSVIENVLQLLKCPCSSEPHLALLYSSITSKIMAWYQTAAGVNPTIRPSASISASHLWSNCQPSPFSQTIPSPSSVPGINEVENFNLYMQPSLHRHYDFDNLEQQRYRRQLVLHELRGCRQIIEALANWRGNSPTCEQAEFLYDMLGGWLKGQLYKMVKEIENREA